MGIVHVAVPGPWWNLLSYTYEGALAEGVRVRVPLGNSFRVGFIADIDSDTEDVDANKIKGIDAVIDDVPVLPNDLWKTVRWFGDTWFVGLGMAAKTLLPSKFICGHEAEPPASEALAEAAPSSVTYVYEPRDADRYEVYADMAEKSPRPGMVLFPEVSAAKRFWNTLSKQTRDIGVLWPVTNRAKQWDIWKKALSGEIKFIAGSQGASFLPLRGLSMVVVDDECSGAWRTQRHPIFHHRTLLAARARFAGAELVLGGRMPSSKTFMEIGPGCGKNGASKRTVFVDIGISSSFDVTAVKDRIPISKPLIRRTIESRRRKEWVFWLLDRKGYAGEVYCRDCGASVRCSMCGGIMRWEGRRGRFSCLSCGKAIDVPNQCPACGGPFLEGVRPGLEALKESASSLFKRKGEEILLFQDEEVGPNKIKKIREEYPDGAILLGTRKILSLADDLSPSLIGWIDADAEARMAEYDARVKAFALIWESLWRGEDPEKRVVVVQSRRPGTGWQAGLMSGWRVFWESELRYRKELELPPFMPMIKLSLRGCSFEKLAEALSRYNIEHWESEDAEQEIWIRTRNFGTLKKILKPLFHIRNTKTGFPSVLLCLD